MFQYPNFPRSTSHPKPNGSRRRRGHRRSPRSEPANHGRQADADEQVLERIEARILADHQEAIEADNFDAVCAARDRITAEGHGK